MSLYSTLIKISKKFLFPIFLIKNQCPLLLLNSQVRCLTYGNETTCIIICTSLKHKSQSYLMGYPE